MVSDHVADASPDASRLVIDGRYEVIREIGRGAMGVVYHVHDRATERDLALKQLQGRARSTTIGRQERSAVRFRREFHTIVGLTHPCVVAAYEYGIDREQPYYTMELLQGPTLRDLVGAEVPQCCRMLRGVASALAFLHARRLLHRDLKARNVRCDDRGRPKLLDFGVLATMGVAGEVAGTPPGIPPEALRGLPLDARADLFGLGTLAYRMLTGRQAFAAESVDQLEDHWRHQPERPSRLRSEVPPALDDLVMSLISIDLALRPSSAAEVLARLDAIGELEHAPELEVAHGWLQSARLVGRRRELETIREVARSTTQGQGRGQGRGKGRGKGQMLVLEGPSGVGKTRLLREAGLHAQLAGATVLRGRGRGDGYAPYDLVRQLVRDMRRVCPDDAHITGARRGAVLGRVLPELRGDRKSSDLAVREAPAEERLRVQQELLDWFLALAERRPLFLLIDDLERCDEGSASLLAALGHVAPLHPVSVVGTRRTDIEAPPREVLWSVARTLRLGELDRRAVGELVDDWFGEISGADALVEWIHGAAGGSPLFCSELARHLVEQGAVLYAEGMWRLVIHPSEIEVPPRMNESMDLRVAGLTSIGRSLAQAIALWRGPAPVELCAELIDTADPFSVFEALDELVFEEILVGGDEGFDLSHDGVRDALLRSLDAEERAEIHRRTAELIIDRWGPRGGEREADLGWHLLRGGRRREGALHLERAGRRRFELRAFEDAIGPLEAALEVYRSEDAPGDGPRCLELQGMLVRAGVIGGREVVLRYAEPTIEAYAHHSGLSLANRVGRWLGRRAGLGVGLALAQLRWWLRGRRRGLPRPRAALTVAVALVNYVASVHAMAFDAVRVAALRRRIDPVRAIGADVARASIAMIDGFAALAEGRWADAHREMAQVLAIFEGARLHPVAEMDRQMFVGGARAVQVVMDAIDTSPRFTATVDALRQLELRFFTLGAEMSRVYYHRLRGEEGRARTTLHETELSVVQLGNSWTYENVRAWVSALAFGLTGDVVALRRVADELERLRRSGQGLDAFVALANAEIARLQNDPEAACERLEHALSQLGPQRCFPMLTLEAALVDAQLDAGRAEDALATATTALEHTPEDIGLRVSRIRARCGRALALARCDQLDAAEAELDALVAEAAEIDSPLLVGLIHEAGARVAEHRGDAIGRRHHAAQAELMLVSTGNPVLVRRARRLMQAAETRSIQTVDEGGGAGTADSDVVDTVDISEPDEPEREPGGTDSLSLDEPRPQPLT